MIAKWLITNLITVFIIVIWSFYQGYDSNHVLIGKIVAQAAFILFLININMFFVFLLIRKSKVRNVKIKLAKISKRMMKYHIPIALTSSTLILIHAVIMINAYFERLLNIKTLSGAITFGVLIILLFSGLLRRWKASGNRRKFHYTMAFLFFAFVILHVFV